MNIFRTIIVPEALADTYNSIAHGFGQGDMFIRKCGVGGELTHRIASGVLDGVFDSLLNPTTETVEMLSGMGVLLSLQEAQLLASQVMSTDRPGLETLQQLGMTLEQL